MTGWALITGGAKRIGREIALDLATHGWDIIIHYHTSSDDAQNLAREIAALGRGVILAEIDLSHRHAAAKLIPALAKEIGMIDALINNAALFAPDHADPDGARHWAVNAEAARILSQAFRDPIASGEKAAIVNMLDATPTPDNFTAYEKTKQFRFALTRDLAKNFAPQVRVNGIACGYVLPSPRQSEASFRALAGDKIVAPQQIAAAVRHFIETPDLTGQILTLA